LISLKSQARVKMIKKPDDDDKYVTISEKEQQMFLLNWLVEHG